MGTTSNFGFPYPESTDLVRDGAQAIEDLADAVDGKVATGFLFAGQVIYDTVGTFNFEKNDPLGTGDIGLRAVRVRMVGAGGGSGGCGTTGANQIACGGGGGAGGYAEKFILAEDFAATESVTVPGGGAGGAAGANNGTAGSPTTGFGMTAGGGGFGNGSSAQGFVSFALVVADGGTASGGDINIAGGSALHAFGFGPGRPGASKGGASQLGEAAAGRVSLAFDGVSPPAASFGAGGTGAINSQNQGTARPGAAGAQGIVIVDLFV